VKQQAVKLLAAFILQASARAAGDAVTPLPAMGKGETLRYRLLWPSGVTLGEAVAVASPSDKGWSFALTVEANLPARDINDEFTSLATGQDLCSLEFPEKVREGTKAPE